MAIYDLLKKVQEEHDKQRLEAIKELLDIMCIADDKEVFVVEITSTMYKWDELKAEQRVYYYICETMESVKRLIKSLQNVESVVMVYEGISKNKIKEIERISYGNS